MSDKHEPAKHDAPKKTGPAELDAKIPHEQAVAEGVKAAESHRQTTEDVVVAEHKPVKAPPPHPLLVKMTKLKDEVADMAKRHKEEVLELRDKLQKLQFELPADMPGHSANSFLAVSTQIEEGINMLDPDSSARAPH